MASKFTILLLSDYAFCKYILILAQFHILCILYNIYIITWSVFMDPKDSVIMRLTYICLLVTSYLGDLWETPECTTNTSKTFNAQRCIMSVENQCKSKPHTVTKILRTTVDMYRDALIEHDDVMLIQLFRDPRGVVNSKQRTGWYSSMLKDLTNDVKCLCARMLEDYKSGLEFQKKFPGKFMFVVYEDLLSHLPNKLDRLYKKLGMQTLDHLTNISEEFKKLVGLHKANPTKTKSKDYEFWWRSNLTLATVQTVDKNCKDIYTAIGYKSFNSEKHLRDHSINSVTVKDAMKL